MVDASSATGLREPLASSRSSLPGPSIKILPKGCTQCLWSLPRYGLPVVCAHPVVPRLIFYTGCFLMITFLDMEEEQASLLMALLVIGSMVLLFTLRKAVDRLIALEGPGNWEGLRQADAAVLTTTKTDFAEACARTQGDYPMRLSVLKAYSIENPELEASFENVQAELPGEDPCIRRFYHGTSAFAVREIVSSGFELPSKAGMFGKGVYFADTPLKSWQYSTLGFMLICDVALGRQKQAFTADTDLTLEKLNGEHDSVVGMTTAQGGVLRQPEWIVYRPDQAIPRLLLWVCNSDQEEAVVRNLARDVRVARAIVNFIFMTFMGFFLSVITVVIIGVVTSFD